VNKSDNGSLLEGNPNDNLAMKPSPTAAFGGEVA
jgi:hypothetical protein